MSEIEYKLLDVNEIARFRIDLISLMENVLSDNITQRYPKNLAEQYVEKMPGYISDGTAIIVGAFCDDLLVGFSWAYELSVFNERRIHIDMIGVKPEYRKNGIARKLVEMQIDEAKNRKIAIIEAMTTKANNNSYNWFHSIGFVDERVKVKLELE